MNDLDPMDRLLSTAFLRSRRAGVEPAAGSEARGPGTLLSFERSGPRPWSGLNLRAHEYALARERPVRFGGLAH